MYITYCYYLQYTKNYVHSLIIYFSHFPVFGYFISLSFLSFFLYNFPYFSPLLIFFVSPFLLFILLPVFHCCFIHSFFLPSFVLTLCAFVCQTPQSHSFSYCVQESFGIRFQTRYTGQVVFE